MSDKQDNAITQWLESHEYLPSFMRDFHDQKHIFKEMHKLYQSDNNENKDAQDLMNMPTWITGHVYVIDWFLWYMAGRGYTLQKSKKKIEFWDFE